MIPCAFAQASRPAQKIAFPAISDWSTLKITLQRTFCYGHCPDYEVEIDGDGTVKFNGRYDVVARGKHRTRISKIAVRELYNDFARANFFWAFDKYSVRASDAPAYTVTISFDHYKKTVVDYLGKEAGIPKEIAALEDAVDQTAGTKKWIGGGFKFR